MATYEFRLINANEKLEPNHIQVYDNQLAKLKKQVNPNESQCIALSDCIILDGAYHPDAIISYKIPRKETDHEINKYPKNLQEEAESIINKHKLTKKLSKKLYDQNIEDLNNDILDLENKIKLLNTTAIDIVEENDKIKQIAHFNNSYTKFNECLTSQLSTFDAETKEEIRKKLNIIIKIIDDVVVKYLP